MQRRRYDKVEAGRALRRRRRRGAVDDGVRGGRVRIRSRRGRVPRVPLRARGGAVSVRGVRPGGCARVPTTGGPPPRVLLPVCSVCSVARGFLLCDALWDDWLRHVRGACLGRACPCLSCLRASRVCACGPSLSCCGRAVCARGPSLSCCGRAVCVCLRPRVVLLDVRQRRAATGC